MFLAIGALTSQLAPTRRQASGLAAAVLAAGFVIRLVADSVAGASWMRWASPLGWVENLRPLTGARPVAHALAGEQRPVGRPTRALGRSRLDRRPRAARGDLRDHRPLRSAGQRQRDEIEQAVSRLGGHPTSATAAWIGTSSYTSPPCCPSVPPARSPRCAARKPTATSTTCSPPGSIAEPGWLGASASASCSSQPPRWWPEPQGGPGSPAGLAGSRSGRCFRRG